jgi:hypothetical protein
MNVYLYVHNNPINHIDPLGLSWWSDTLSVAKSAVEGARGGLSIVVSTFTFGGSDKLGLTDSSQYQGKAYDASRTAARISRTAAIAAATGGAMNAMTHAAAAGSTVAQVGVTGAKLVSAGYAAKSAGQNLGEASVEAQTGEYGKAAFHATLGVVDAASAVAGGVSAAKDVSRGVSALRASVSPEGSAVTDPGNIKPYKELQKDLREAGLSKEYEAHKLVEKRHGIGKFRDSPAVPLKKGAAGHQKVTNQLRQDLPYGRRHSADAVRESVSTTYSREDWKEAATKWIDENL